ncbi:MAG: MFS transporter [Rhodospirillaceae bacterium]|nr:MFS transporter [Rhodospirillaceae bacterium]
MTTEPLDSPAEASAVRKVFARIAIACAVIYVVAYLDRINVGFAALAMNKDLGLSATAFGIASTTLFLMYSAFEVPSSMLLLRMGMRLWLARIMITWGLASMATMFAEGPYSLYALRALVGIAEAGLMPGVLFYISLWFPLAHRARANSIFLASLPLSIVIGGPISGALLEMDGFLGLAGWRWLFLLEGAPAIILGICVLIWLPDRPAEAKWLSDEEKLALQARLDRENAAGPASHGSAWKEIVRPQVVLLALAFFGVLASASTLGVWTPQIVNEVVGGARPLVIGFLTAIPPLIAVVFMQWASKRSDRTKERIGHLMAVMAVAAVGWAMVVVMPVPTLKLAGLSLSASGVYAAMAIFWAAVTQVLGDRNRAVGMAAIQSVAILASVVSPLIMGILRDATHNFYAGIWYAAVLLVVGIGLFAVAVRWAPAKATA